MKGSDTALENKINVLDFKVANLIAAGEVVERPASAIKELIENSVDAGAKNITVEIQNGGISLMRVTDDGCGMSREDTEMCIRRHATSKIKDASDLAYIITLGFRGEALAAIASVSRLRIFSKRREDQVGTLLSSDGGRNVTVTETGCASGTTVIAEELFANVPARRKFLKKDAAETMAVTGIVEKAALAHPEIAISLICDGKLRYRTSGDGDLRSAIYAVMGRECANNLIPVRALSDGIEINGFVGTPELIRKNRHGESFFLNGRYVRNTTVQSALEAAFRTYIPSDKFPMSVLHLKIHPSLVDVNVHPAKLEVKFAEERKVFEAIYAAVRGALTHSIPRPEYGERTPDDKRQEGEAALSSFVPLPDRTERKKPEDRSLFIDASGLRTRSVHDCFGTGASGVGSMSGGTGSASLGTVGAGNIDRRLLDIEYDGALTQEKTAGGATENNGAAVGVGDGIAENDDVSGNYATTDVSSDMSGGADGAPIRRDGPEHGFTPAPDPFASRRSASVHAMSSACGTDSGAFGNGTESGDHGNISNKGNGAGGAGGSDAGDDNILRDPSAGLYTGGASGGYPGTSAVGTVSGDNTSHVPVYYRIIGIAANAYVFVEVSDGVVVIDKHAAHERILFERMKENMYASRRCEQLLLIPEILQLSPEEFAAACEYRDEIEKTGFSFDADEETLGVKLTSRPSEIEQSATGDVFMQILSSLSSGGDGAERSQSDMYERALFQASCKAAVKAGREDDISHIEYICDAVMNDPRIRFCPHGRPVSFELTTRDIEKRFKRI
jgi:DNA mismatch repair protein mutL